MEYNKIPSQLMERSYKLLRASIESSSLNDLAVCAAKMFGNPFLFVDSTYNVAGYSNNSTIDDITWNKCIQAGYIIDEITEEILDKYRKLDMNVIDNTSFDRPLESSKYKWIVSNAYFKKHLMGTINMLCVNSNDINNELDTLTFKMIADIFAKSMVSNSGNSVDFIPYEDIFKELMSNSISNKLLLKNKIENTELIKIKEFTLISVYFETYLRSVVASFASKLKSIHFIRSIFNYEKYLLILVDSNFLNKNLSLLNKLESLLNLFSVKACISDSFGDLTCLYDYYNKNKRALLYSSQFKDNEILIYYGKYRFWDMINCAKESTKSKTAEKFVDQVVLKIISDDKINDTDYFKTLLTFLRTNKSYKQTAEKLFCHKNTIVYRISQLKDFII